MRLGHSWLTLVPPGLVKGSVSEKVVPQLLVKVTGAASGALILAQFRKKLKVTSNILGPTQVHEKSPPVMSELKPEKWVRSEKTNAQNSLMSVFIGVRFGTIQSHWW